MIQNKLIRKYFRSETHEAASQLALGACRLCASGDLYEQVKAISIRSDLDIAEIVSGERNGLDDLQRSPLVLFSCGCLLFSRLNEPHSFCLSSYLLFSKPLIAPVYLS